MEPYDGLLIDMEKDERWRDLLGEVLAVLNRDGGHYQARHGAGKAAIEGIRSYYALTLEADKVATLTTELQKAQDDRDRYREALEDMAWQHAYRVDGNDGPCLSTGGLSANEHAFDVLGWDDPKLCADVLACEIEGCMRWRESGLRWGDLYLGLCGRHSGECFAEQERPPVKASAIQREALRDKDGVLPPNWERALAGTGETP